MAITLDDKLYDAMVSARLPENHLNAVFDLANRHLPSIEDSRAFLIYLAMKSLDDPKDICIVLSSWGLLEDTRDIKDQMKRREEIIRLLKLGCVPSNLNHRENNRYRKILVKRCQMFHDYPESIEPYLAKANASAKARNYELPTLESIFDSSPKNKPQANYGETASSHLPTITRDMLDEFYERIPPHCAHNLKKQEIKPNKPSVFKTSDDMVVDFFGAENETLLQKEYQRIVREILRDMEWIHDRIPDNRFDDTPVKLNNLQYIDAFFDIINLSGDESVICEYFTLRHAIVEKILGIDKRDYDQEVLAYEQEFYQSFSNALGRVLLLRYQISAFAHRSQYESCLHTHVIPVTTEVASKAVLPKLPEVIIYLDNKETIATELPALLEDKNNWYIAVLPEGFIASGEEYFKS